MPKRQRILFLAHLFPLPLDSGGKIKSYYILKTLASRHDVRILAYTRTDDELSRLSELEKICPVDSIPLTRGKLRQASDLASSMFTFKSFIVSRDFRQNMHDAFNRIISDFNPDVVHIDHLQMAQFVDFSAGYKTVLDHHNVECMIIKRLNETSPSLPIKTYAAFEWPKLKRYELDICRQCDLVMTVSDEDRRTLIGFDNSLHGLECVPIGVDIEYFKSIPRDPASRNILSIGTMYWPPNVESMLYFYRDILPIVKHEIPDCRLTIAGQRPVESIQALAADPVVKVTGYIDDVREVAADCGVFIVPLRSGSGVRVKILNALAMGLPVVSTSVGVEGLAVEHGEHLLIADTPEEFSNAVVQVLNDPALGERLGNNGRALVCEEYSWERVGERLLKVYHDRFGE